MTFDLTMFLPSSCGVTRDLKFIIYSDYYQSYQNSVTRGLGIWVRDYDENKNESVKSDSLSTMLPAKVFMPSEKNTTFGRTRSSSNAHLLLAVVECDVVGTSRSLCSLPFVSMYVCMWARLLNHQVTGAS